MMLRNACECLKPGGYFILTTPDAYEIMQVLDLLEPLIDGRSSPFFGKKLHLHCIISTFFSSYLFSTTSNLCRNK